MPFVRDKTASLRDNILEQIRSRFDGDAPTSGIVWEKVYRSPLPAKDKIGRSALSILDVKEKKRDDIGATSCTLQVSTEFVCRVQKGDDVSKEVNRYLLDIQRTMLRDQQCAYLDDTNTSRQLAINMSEAGSEIDIEGPGDQLVGGIVFWQLQYRHRPDDPAKHRGE